MQNLQKMSSHLELVSQERGFYHKTIKESRGSFETDVNLRCEPNSAALKKVVHYSFDMVQEVHIPSVLMQPVMPVGHTKFSCHWGFGLLKKRFRTCHVSSKFLTMPVKKRKGIQMGRQKMQQHLFKNICQYCEEQFQYIICPEVPDNANEEEEGNPNGPAENAAQVKETTKARRNKRKRSV
ncbi:hypothetical protein J6590_102298 [Homalodisca vitripennis]|nr:hypothetical protein J6590_102298 [Homalodisca vitripennis]